MRIKVEAEGHCFALPVPLSIIINGFTAKIIKICIKKYVPFSFSGKHLLVLVKELKRAKKNFPNLVLVDIKTSNGERVLITL